VILDYDICNFAVLPIISINQNLAASFDSGLMINFVDTELFYN